jgi:hypothetical protein
MRILPIAAAFVLTSGIGMADIMGIVWTGAPDASDASDPANMSSTLPSAQFTSAGINYNSNSTGYTVGQFLNSPTFTNEQNGFDPTDSAGNIEVQLVGTIFLSAGPHLFRIDHDGALALSINSGASTIDDATGDVPVFSDSGATTPVLTQFIMDAGADANYTFTLDYAECCGSPAVLEFDDPPFAAAAVPEPSALILLITAGALLVKPVRRWRRPTIARS